jgi:hyperosmotically inducible protein
MLQKTILCGALTFLTVNPLIASAETASVAQNAQNDTAITATINTLYSGSALVKMSKIGVTTNNQNVILTGNVDTDAQYEQAVELAQSVAGVNDVNADNLTVKSSKAPLTDTYITAKVKGIIMKEKFFGGKDVEYWPVSIETKDGVVYLTGIVDTDAQRTNIDNLAKSINGVKSVNNTITVK